MTSWNAVTWDTARAGGFAAYVLLTCAVSAGLVLRNRWQTARWPRLITNELHGYLSLLALVFIAVHVVAVLLDPFTRFGLVEVLAPFASHYRPVWMGLGVVALYLLLAVWVSSRLRAHIDFRTWRAIHALSYGVYAAATIHGLGTGSDTRTAWASALYAASVLVVGGLAGRRLLVPTSRGQRPRPVLAAVGGLAITAIAIWSVTGPLAAHWGARAGGGSGSRAAASTRSSANRSASPAALPSGRVSTPFGAAFAGRVTVRPVDVSGRVTVRIDGALRGGTRDHLEIYLRGTPLDDGGVAMEQSRVRMGAATPMYRGEIVGLRGSQLVAALRSNAGPLRLVISLSLAGDGSVSGTVHGTGTAA
jgi:DMSO/TMAO reductase YedYZ heme-binding membrane subunit